MIIRLIIILCLGLMAGCATTGGQSTAPRTEPLLKATEELDEAQLLNVDIALFSPGTLPEGETQSRGLSAEIREAEARFMPIHLRSVMEKTGYWGAVRVVPSKSEGFELYVSGTIIASDGEIIDLKIEAEDAQGRLWLSRVYKGNARIEDYDDLSPGADGFEPLYRRIANDLANFRSQLSDQQRTEIRRIADMRFASDMAPYAFADHLSKDKTSRYQLLRLPAEDDPAYQRIETIRERDFLLIDTLNGHYENFYREMQVPYEEWRKARSIEKEALRKVKNRANANKALGIAAIIAAIAIEATGSPNTRAATGTLRDVMVLGGAYSIKRGMDINAQSTIHEEEISELGMSFSAEAEPLVIEVDGEVHKLSGSAEAQYTQWRGLMRDIYESETGAIFEPQIDAEPQTEADAESPDKQADATQAPP